MASIFRNNTDSSTPTPPVTSLRVQTSIEGMARSILWGFTRIAGNLIWYGDFNAVTVNSNSGDQGGKGGLFQAPASSGSSSYNYYASVEIALCEGPVAAIGPRMWASKSVTDLATSNLGAFLGGASQVAWSYLSAQHPGQAFAYRLTAYVAGNVSLGSSAELPNWTFEVAGAISFSVPGQFGADPTLVIADFLTNANYGVPGWSSAYNGDWTNAQNYLLASGLVISYALTAQTSASAFLQEFLTSLNVMPVWSESVLKLAPRGDQIVSGNGHAYFPPTVPQYDLSDSDFLPNQASFGGTNADPVSGQQKPARSLNNIVKVEYLDRSADYNPASLQAQDDGAILLYGERGSKNSNAWHWFQEAAPAQLAAQLALGREKIQNNYAFTLRPRFILLEPGIDIVTITDATLGLFRQWVRILDIQENADRSLNFLVEEYLQGTGAAPAYGQEVSSGSRPNYNADPGGINQPIIFEPTDELAGGLEVWAAISGANQTLYGGCDAWISYDGATYSKVPGGRQFGSARMGVLSAPLPGIVVNNVSQTIDTTNTLHIDLTESAGVLSSGTQTDALNLNTACWVDGEVLSYQTATLTGVDTYDVTYLVRGVYGTESAIGVHAAGAPFVRIDSGILRIPFDKTRIGATIQLKFVPFNVWGVQVATIADVPAYSYVIAGSALASPLPTVGNVRTVFEAGYQKIWWDEVSDFRSGIRYRIKKGSAPNAAQVLGDLAHPPFVVFGDGIYWIEAYCQPVAGLLVYSELPTSITIAGSMLTLNVLATIDFQAQGWTGTLMNVAKEGVDPTTFLRLDSTANILADPDVLNNPDLLNAGGIAASGMWTSDFISDAGYVADCSVNVSWLSAGQPVGQDILSITDFLNSPDILAAASIAFVDVWIEIRTASTSTLGVPDWGSWQRFVPGVYRCEFIQLRAPFVTLSPNVIAYLLALTAQISLPARIDNYLGNNVTTGGLTIVFEPDDAISAKPFNGGPLVGGTNNHPLPAVSMDWQGSSTANYIIDAISLSQMTFHFVDGTGATVAVNGVDVHVEGY